MKKELVCVYLADFIMGGIESYYVRMFEWAFRKKINASLIILEGNYIHEKWYNVLCDLNVKVAYYARNIFENSIIDKNGNEVLFSNKCKYQVITTDIHSYLRMKRIREKYRLYSMSVIMYSFLPSNGVGSVKKILNLPFIPYFKKMKDSALIMMDEECKMYCEERNNIKLSKECIKRLGIVIPELPQELILRRAENREDTFNILSISRMDFPFKGYILGLLDVFERMKKKYPSMKLTLIGKGKDSEIVRKRILCMNKSVQQDIKLIDEVEYSNLKIYFEDSQLYIGMGTTLLDAGLSGLVGVTATSYQCGEKTTGYFVNMPNNISGNLTILNAKEIGMEECINRAINCSKDEYIALSIKNYECIRAEYDIEKIMPKLFAIESYIDFHEIIFRILNIYTLLFSTHKYWKKDREKKKNEKHENC